MDIKNLTELGFKGPWPHGEYYLFDESIVKEDGKCCIMSVYPSDGETGWQASYNSQRGWWCDDKNYFDSGWINFNNKEELELLINKSRALN